MLPGSPERIHFFNDMIISNGDGPTLFYFKQG